VCNAKQDEGAAFPERGRVCSKCMAERSAQYYQENRESVIARSAQYYKDNKEHIVKRHARYHEENKEHINAQDRQQYHERVASQRVVRLCIDCGKAIPKRARKYCPECKDKNHRNSVKLSAQRLRSQKKSGEKKL